VILSKSPANDVTATATVWLVDSRTVDEANLLSHLAWLNPDETARYRRFVRPERQRQFLIGRILLRHALSSLLDIDAQTISLIERSGQAPLLNMDGLSPGFSLSHSGPWIGCAISAHTALGLDVEVLDGERDLIALSLQAFDRADAALVAQQHGAERVATFYRLWSTKEASYKLASTTSNTNRNTTILTHPAISIVVCSEFPLAEAALYALNDWPAGLQPE
jgi:4'-phosphopantetheinyl transferase